MTMRRVPPKRGETVDRSNSRSVSFPAISSTKKTTSTTGDASAVDRSPSPTEYRRALSSLPKYSDRTHDHGAYNAGALQKTVPRTRIVDWSFMDFEDFKEIRNSDKEPREGLVVKKKEKPKETQQAPKDSDKKLDKKQLQAMSNQQLFFGSGTGKSHRTDDGFVVMRAKEETYAFKEEADDPHAGDTDMHQYVLNADGVLVEKADAKRQEQANQVEKPVYHCTTLKLNNNAFKSVLDFIPFVQAVVYKPATFLTIVDLSCNEIEILPPSFESLPLHTLLLHQNKISSINEVRKLQSSFQTLRKLTLNGNPIQTTTKRYKYVILHHLPFLLSLDDVRVTLKDRERMETFEQLFVSKKERGTTTKFLPEVIPRSQSQLGVLGQYF